MKLSKPIFTILLFTVSDSFSFAQRSWVEKTNSKGAVVERFEVLTADSIVKDGLYNELNNGNIRAQGFYSAGERSGKWEFGQPTDGLYFFGSYESDLKQGKWTYTLSNKICSELYYSLGAVDSVNGYFENGSKSYELRLDTAGNGISRHYYNSGQIKWQGTIRKYVLDGETQTYFPNGQLHTRAIYLDDRPITVLKTLDRSGNDINTSNLTNGNGKFVEYNVSENSTDLTIYRILNFNDSLQHGPYELYTEEGLLFERGHFQYGNKVGYVVRISENGTKVDSTFNKSINEKEVFKPKSRAYQVAYSKPSEMTIVERMPSFPGGEAALLSFLGKNISYPHESLNNGIQGNVFVAFVIDTDGNVIDEKILRSLAPDIDQESIRVVRSMPRWDPGIQFGCPVKVQYNLPLKFSLQTANVKKKKGRKR